ncbi:MAG: YbaB/EbfC family nucleoid-associated protein [Bdellovibrionia bacterium]
MKGMPGGMQKFIQQANQLQSKIKKLQEELATREFEATAGGGAVTVKVNGDNKILALTIKEDVMKAGDVEMLQDLVLTAVNEAIRIAKETSETEMNKLTGGFSMPGMM